jgi:hypothetical protein
VIGAVIGGGVTFLLDRRREQRAARAGLRLVVAELRRTQGTWQTYTAASEAPTVEETGEWLVSELRERPLRTEQWKNYQEVLAASLSAADWKALADAYAVIGLVNEAVQTAVDPEHRTELVVVMTETRPIVDRAAEHFQRRVGRIGP